MASERIEARFREVTRRLADALARARRGADACRLLAVTKTRSVAEIEALAACGQREFGENRVQEAAEKIPVLASAGRWHLIGHLQRNKAKKAVELFDVVHSVDSVRLLEEIARHAGGRAVAPEVLLEVNVSGEVQKQGLRPDEVAEVCRRARDLPQVRLTGLMTMAPLAGRAEDVRHVFRGLRELRDRLNDVLAPAMPLVELSMGMTQDFEVAAEEGATWVRVGTALFE